MFRSGWVRRVLVGLLVSFGLAVAGVFVDRARDRRAGEKRYAAAVAHLDATDPRWRYDEISADQGHLPDDQNGARLVPQVRAVLVSSMFDKELPADYSSTAVPPNRHLPVETDDDPLDRILAANADALAIALRFADRPHGRRQYTLDPIPILTRLPEVQDTRFVARLLDLAAERAGRDGRGGIALGYVRPMVNVSRSLESEPFLIATLARMGCLRMAAARVERTLALAEPRGRLAEVQTLLLQEAEADLFWYGVRGERAVIDVLFTRMRDGTLPLGSVVESAGSTGDLRSGSVSWRYAPHLPGDHGTFLEVMAKAHEARRLSEHQQRAALREVERAIQNLRGSGLGSLLTRLLTPAFANAHDHSLRVKAHLRCAAAGIAVERFRLANGRWPTTLDEVPKDLLPAVPLDPFDGKPLRYARRDDGVTVYSVGLDEKDDGGVIRPDLPASETRQDVGFRLYDPVARGRPAESRRVPNLFGRDPEESEKRADGAPPEEGPEPREVEAPGGS